LSWNDSISRKIQKAYMDTVVEKDLLSLKHRSTEKELA